MSAEAISSQPERTSQRLRVRASYFASMSAYSSRSSAWPCHGDPVGIGHVASLARPGGNATGLTTLLTELVAKELEAFKEALPQARRLGVLYASTNPLRVSALGTAKATARRLGFELRGFPVGVDDVFPNAFAKMTQDGVDGCMVLSSPLMISRRALLAELALGIGFPQCSERRITSLPVG